MIKMARNMTKTDEIDYYNSTHSFFFDPINNLDNDVTLFRLLYLTKVKLTGPSENLN